MKKYNYVINGVSYEVTISEESDSSAKVEVNGELYMVEKSNAAGAAPVAARPRPVTPQPAVQPSATTRSYSGSRCGGRYQFAVARCYHESTCKTRRCGEEGADLDYSRGYENGE